MTDKEKKLKALEERAKRMKVQYIDLDDIVLSQDLSTILPFSFARQHLIVPVKVENDVLTAALENPNDLYLLEQLETRTKMKVKTLLADSQDILKAISIIYSQITHQDIEIPALEDDLYTEIKTMISQEIIDWFIDVIITSLNRKASDIHIEPYRHEIKVRYRIDGVIAETVVLPKDMEMQISNLLKTLSNMKLVIKRTPQEGILTFKVRGKDMVMRVNSITTLYGDRFILRIMDEGMPAIKLTDLGLELKELKKIKSLVNHRQGLVLFSGPSGSGVCSTLYSVLQHISAPEINIFTIEDPIEASLHGVNQVEVNNKTMKAHECITSVLRHAPDVIMISKANNKRIAQLAIEAALSGQLVLAGIYARNTIDTITRLRDLGIDPYFIATTLLGVVSQRLVRKVCPFCAETQSISQSLKDEMQMYGISEPYNLKRGRGCKQCLNTGYKGRIGIFEILPFNDALKDLILSNTSRSEMEDQAEKDEIQVLFVDGLIKVAHGITTYEEFKRVLIQ